jgi:hypothetical protein
VPTHRLAIDGEHVPAVSPHLLEQLADRLRRLLVVGMLAERLNLARLLQHARDTPLPVRVRHRRAHGQLCRPIAPC